MDLTLTTNNTSRDSLVGAPPDTNRLRANAHNSGNYETRDNARRTDRASTTPWLRSPASIVARRAITLIVRLGT